MNPDQIRRDLQAVTTGAVLDLVADQIADIDDAGQRQELTRLYHQRRDALAALSTAREPDAMTEHYDDPAVPELAAATVAGDLLAALIDELRLMTKPWQSLPEVDQGDVVLLVVAGAAQYTGGLDQVQAEPDQRALGLGKEYTEEAA